MRSSPAGTPVFVDTSGRRHRRVRVAGAALAVPAIVYLVLLASSLLGGPTPGLQFVPLPGDSQQQSDHRPKVKPTPVASETTADDRPTDSPSSEVSTSPRQPVVDVTTTTPSSTPSPTVTVVPTTTPTPTATPSRPGATPTKGHGRPDVPPGRTKTPSKP